MQMCEEKDDLRLAVARSKAEQKIYWQEEEISFERERFLKRVNIVLSPERSLQAAAKYARQGKKVGILNFASSVTPGGGVVRGASAQEESLCRISTLYPALSDEETAGYFYRLHRQMIHSGKMGRENRDDCIFTPGVLVVCEDTLTCTELPEDQWYQVDMITCAAPDLRADSAERMFQPAEEELTCLHEKRLRKILSVAASQKEDVVILGAFGCGVFRNPPHIVVNAFQNIIEEFAHCFQTIEFAIFARSREDANYQAFSSLTGGQARANQPWTIDWTISIPSINRTVAFITNHGWGLRDEDVSDQELSYQSELFEGGSGGRCAYKIFRYAMKYIGYEHLGIRYRYLAAALLTLWDFHRDWSREGNLATYYRNIMVSGFLKHEAVSNEYFMRSKLTESCVDSIYKAYVQEHSIEALTMLKVLRALEWDDWKMNRLCEDMKNNRFH